MCFRFKKACAVCTEETVVVIIVYRSLTQYGTVIFRTLYSRPWCIGLPSYRLYYQKEGTHHLAADSPIHLSHSPDLSSWCHLINSRRRKPKKSMVRASQLTSRRVNGGEIVCLFTRFHPNKQTTEKKKETTEKKALPLLVVAPFHSPEPIIYDRSHTYRWSFSYSS